MTNYAEQQPLGMIERGLANDTAQFIMRIWKEHQSSLSIPDELTRVSPDLLLMAGECAPENSPEILFVGKRTLLGKLLPSHRSTRPRSLIDHSFRRLVHRGYTASIEGEPYFDTIGTDCVAEGHPFHIVYDRLLLPWRLRSGLLHLTCLTIPRVVSPQNNQPNPMPDLRYLQRKQGRHQWLQAPRPN